MKKEKQDPTKRKKVEDTFAKICHYDSFDSIISTLQSAQEAEKTGLWTNLIIEPYEFYEEQRWDIKGLREETDKEYSSRMKKTEKTRKAKAKALETIKAKEIKEYERLKQKYGDK